jgi:hypothetical protein
VLGWLGWDMDALANIQRLCDDGVCATGTGLVDRRVSVGDGGGVGRGGGDGGGGGGGGTGSCVPVGILFHREDGMIPFHASLVASLGHERCAAVEVLELRQLHLNPHMYPLSSEQEEFKQVLALANQLLLRLSS